MRFNSVLLAIATAIAALTLFVQLAAALPAAGVDVPENNWKSWARFCDGEGCTGNCGEWVDLSNPGCLNEANRKSIHVKTNGEQPIAGLVYSPGRDCPCQTTCTLVRDTHPDCWELNSTLAASTLSYRFVSYGDRLDDPCSADNCSAEFAELDASEVLTATDVETRAEEAETTAVLATEIEQTTDVVPYAVPTTDDHTAVSTTNQTSLNPALTTISPPSEKYDGGWARFCNDQQCGSGCGMWVSLTNSACLTENFRGSIELKNTGANIRIGLVYSPTDRCNCQTRCDEEIPDEFTGGCFALDPVLARTTHSYRLVNWGWDRPCYGANDNC